MTDNWLQSALTNDVLVAELLLRVKHSSASDSDSLRPPPPPVTTKPSTSILPPRWGHRKNRSKSAATKEPRGSPTTHLSWSGGSTSDGYDEACRPSDLSSGCRSGKLNEGASTSSDNKFVKRKSFVEQELTSTRGTLHQQTPTYENLKRIKINLDQNDINKMREHERQMKFSPSPVTQSVSISCRVEAETEAPKRGFVLPDLNMTPTNDEDLAMMS